MRTWPGRRPAPAGGWGSPTWSPRSAWARSASSWAGRCPGWPATTPLALGQAAMVSGPSVVEFGTRNLALHSCLSHRTVARVLRMLAAEDDPLIDLVSPRRMARADRWQLRIPDRHADRGYSQDKAESRSRKRSRWSAVV